MNALKWHMITSKKVLSLMVHLNVHKGIFILDNRDIYTAQMGYIYWTIVTILFVLVNITSL